MKKFREFRQQLDFIGCYLGGKPYGVCWKYCEGGGFLVGEVENGEFSGSHIAFLYPDYLTAIYGLFENGVMKSAKSTVLIDVEYDSKTKILKPIFAEPEANSPSLHYSKSTKTHIGKKLDMLV